MAKSCQNCKKDGKCKTQKDTAKLGSEQMWCASHKTAK